MKANKNKQANNGNLENVDATSSSHKGLAGLFETALRRFRVVTYLLALIPVYFLGILAMSISAIPGIFLVKYTLTTLNYLPEFLYFGAIAFSVISSYFLYGFTLIFVIPLFNFLMPFRLKAFRGGFYSLASVPWYIHNAFTYIVRYTFLEFITPTPLNLLFFRMMGMKIGKGAHINTTNISDPALIEIEDKVTIGGSVHILAHYASKGYLIVEPVKIRKGATIGLKATIMGDVEIGENATIAPHEAILPKTRIPAGRKPFINDEKERIEKQKLPSQDFL
ncbi:MAG: hypothetical protein DWQ05_16075 [Calditrichaeota bacterium]|nr:MAG: hypothetical protein DWQ05_16075 [Calditrichota bacterium]